MLQKDSLPIALDIFQLYDLSSMNKYQLYNNTKSVICIIRASLHNLKVDWSRLTKRVHRLTRLSQCHGI